MNLMALFEHQAQERGNVPALVDLGGGHTLTFAQVAHATAQAAARLRSRGLAPGDAVLLFHPMAAELYVALGAIFRLGAVAMFIDPSMGRAHIRQCCALAPPQGLLATPKAHLLRVTTPALRAIPHKFATGRFVPGALDWRGYVALDADLSVAPTQADTPALMTFTSGSTGRPKVAVRSHGFLHSQHQVLDHHLGLTPDDRVLTTLPIFVLSHLAAGVPTVIPDVDIRRPGRVDPARLVETIRAQSVTCLEGSPAFLERLADYCRTRKLTLTGVSKIFTGGAPVFPDLLAEIQQMAPAALVTTVYGSTEAEPIAHIARPQIGSADVARMVDGGGLLVGAPVPEIRLAIMPDQWGKPLGPIDPAAFQAMALPPDAPGEILVTGRHVLEGYLHGVGDGENKVRVGNDVWHRTGDAGYLDRAGRLWLLGRCAARLEDGAGVLYPFAVECAAHQRPGVRRAAFLHHAGRRILVLEPASRPAHGQDWDATVADLCRDLAWARMDRIHTLDTIPVDKRHNAKVDYPALRRTLDRMGR